MKAGELRERVTFQVPTETFNNAGEKTVTWSNVSTIPTMWAKVEWLSGREMFASQSIHAEVSARITVRYRNDITTKYRILWGTYTFNILSVQPRKSEGSTVFLVSEVK